MPEGVVTVGEAVRAHVDHLKDQAGDGWSTHDEVWASVALELAGQMDEGDLKGQSRMKSLTDALAVAFDRLSPGEAPSDDDADSWLARMSSEVRDSKV